MDFGVIKWFLVTRITSILRANWENKPAEVEEKKEDEIRVSPQSEPKMIASVDMVNLLRGMEFEDEKARVALWMVKNDFQRALDVLTKSEEEFDLCVARNLFPDHTLIKVDSEAVKQLQSMGFKRVDAVEASVLFKGDVRKCADYLVLDENEKEKKKRSIKNNGLSKGQAIPEFVSQLEFMGFNHKKAVEALRFYKNDLQMATDFLLSSKEKQEMIKNDMKKTQMIEEEIKTVKDENVKHLMTMMNLSKKEAVDVLKNHGGDLSRVIALFLGDQVPEIKRTNPIPQLVRPINLKIFISCFRTQKICGKKTIILLSIYTIISKNA